MPDPTGPKAELRHELRTPLNHIIGFTEMLLEEAADRGQTNLIQDLRRIHTAGRQLLTVVNMMFDPHQGTKLDESALHHEIRTPLNQIIGYTEMLQEEAEEMGYGECVGDILKIGEAARHLLRVVVEELVPAQYHTPQPAASTESQATTFMRPSGAEPSTQWPDEPSRFANLALGSRLLVVDDNALNRDMLTRRLRRLGYTVEEASGGPRALAMVQAQPFDLVLLDILMPEMSGHEVLSRLKQDPSLRELPVIVLSASDQNERVAQCIEMGAEDYLSKPFDPVLLQARINASLEKKLLRDREVTHLKQIEEEKKRSDELLHVILPGDIVTELKRTHGVQPRRFERVGVLFCDICGFTAYCDQHPPETVLRDLQAWVETFELLTVQYQLEKIKTIGDSFMATSGLLAAAAHPALDCVRCAVTMLSAAQALPPRWQVRAGVHVGPVVAGVIGHRKYQYDIWGDTVNMAARMEAAANPGTICVAASLWDQLEPHCLGQNKGTIPIKGKGELEVIHITGLKY